MRPPLEKVARTRFQKSGHVKSLVLVRSVEKTVLKRKTNPNAEPCYTRIIERDDRSHTKIGMGFRFFVFEFLNLQRFLKPKSESSFRPNLPK